MIMFCCKIVLVKNTNTASQVLLYIVNIEKMKNNIVLEISFEWFTMSSWRVFQEQINDSFLKYSGRFSSFIPITPWISWSIGRKVHWISISYEHEKSREVIEKFRIHISWKNIEPRRISWIFEAKVISQSHTLTCNRKHTLTQNNYEKWLIAPAQNDFSLFIFCFAHGKMLLFSNHIFIYILRIE